MGTLARLRTALLFVVAVGAFAACGSSGNSASNVTAGSTSPAGTGAAKATTPPTTAKPKAKTPDKVYAYVHGQVAAVETLIAEWQATPPTATDDQLATGAQEAHDNLKDCLDSCADGFSHNGDAGYRGLNAVGEFKNATGALVTYLGTPNAATKASFTTQWNKAQADWNEAVTTAFGANTTLKV